MFQLLPTFVKNRFTCLRKLLVTSLSIFLHLCVRISTLMNTGGVLGHPPQYYQHYIPSITISNEIPYIVFPLILSCCLFICHLLNDRTYADYNHLLVKGG